MPTILDETNPLNEHLAGEQDDHMRSLKGRVKSLFQKGHFLSDTYPSNTSADGQLKFGERVVTRNSVSGNTELDLTAGTIHVLNLIGNTTLTIGDPPDMGDGFTPVDGYGFVLIVKQFSGSGHTISFPANIRWLNGVAPSQNTVAGTETHYSFYTTVGGVGSGGSGWYGFCMGYYSV